MRQFLYCEAGYVEKNQWLPNSWVNVECPTPEDLQFLMDRFNVPESFLSDIADTDERPRIEYEGNWLLTILRIPLQNQDHDIPFNTVPIGISIILMVPTLIASFYGMNVPIYMEDMPHGFVVIILLSILLSATAFFIFRKIKWF